MKTKCLGGQILGSVLVIGCSVLIFGIDAFGQGTAFTYQGRLNNTGNPANGNFDFTFSLYDTNDDGNQIANTITNSMTAVGNGLFTVALDFGRNVFTGANLWLEIGVRPTGSNVDFSTLSPRQPILPTPYSMYAQSAGGIAAGGIAGIPNIQVFTNSGNFSVPVGVNKLMVEVWGGGGGGGNAPDYSYYSGGGGGGGGYGKDVFNVTPGTDFTITVGTGGSAVQAGASSSFGTLISALGGSAGGNGSVSGGVGGAGGASSATFNSNGAKGSGGAAGSSLSYYALTGQQSYVAGGAGGAAGGAGGGGGGGGNGNVVGFGGNGGNGSSPGGGGGGGGEGYRGASGGSGGNGRVVVYW